MDTLKLFFWIGVIGVVLKLVGAVVSVLPYLLGAAVIFFILRECFRDRTPLTPEQKAELAARAAEQEEKEQFRTAERFAEHYYTTIGKIPNSRWWLMSRYEKSEVEAAREQLGFRFDELPERARELAVEKFGIDPKKLRREL